MASTETALTANPCGVTPHDQDHPYVLVRLDAVDGEELGDLLADGWSEVAPKRLAAAFAAGSGR